MNICSGARLRTAVLRAHGGQTFFEFLVELVHGAQTIPHGIEEMAWDLYLHRAGWAGLLPLTLFSVHRSLLAGRDCDDPFRDVVSHSEAAHTLQRIRTEVDIGRVEFGISLPTCRHSQACPVHRAPFPAPRAPPPAPARPSPPPAPRWGRAGGREDGAPRARGGPVRAQHDPRLRTVY